MSRVARTYPLSARLSPDVYDALQRIAEREDRTLSYLVDKYLRQGLLSAGELEAEGLGARKPRIKPRSKNDVAS